MNSVNIAACVNDHPLFKGLDADILSVIVDCGNVRSFECHDYLFYQGKPSSTFFLIVDGAVGIQVYAGESGFITLATYSAGSVIGWTWLLPPYEWVFSGEAAELTRVIAFDGRRLRETCERNPEIGYEISKRFVQLITNRLQDTRAELSRQMA